MEKQARVEYYSKLKSTKVNWLWYPYIPYGKITIIQGDPGEGKTSLALYIATLLSQGRSFPLSDAPVAKQNVVYQNREDGASDTIKPRLERYGADCKRICFILEEDKALSLTDERLETVIREEEASVVILDPIQAYLGDGDMLRASDIRPIMSSLSRVAEKTQCAVILIGHLNKRDNGKDLYRALGSVDIVAAARSVLMVKKPDEEREDLRKLVHVKSNLAQKGKPLLFSLQNDTLCDWRYADSAGNVERSMIELCEQALRQLVGAEGIGSREAFDAMEEKGFSRRTVERAKSNLGVLSRKRGQHWVWLLDQ